jgi:hypothetical protein
VLHGVGSMDDMTTSQQPAPITLAPVSDDKNLLTVVESGSSCCGGGACGMG